MKFEPGIKGNVARIREILKYNCFCQPVHDQVEPVLDKLEKQLEIAVSAYACLLNKNREKTHRILELEGELAGLSLAREEGLAQSLIPEEEGR